MKRKLQFLFLLISFLFSSAMIADDKIHIQTKNNPPFNMNEAGKSFSKESGIKGIATEVLQEVFKRAGVPYQMTLRTPWKRIYKKAISKKNYGVFTAAYTEERKDKFKWVGPLVENEWVAFIAEDSDIKINGIVDLNNYRVGSLNGNAVTRYLTSLGVKTKTVPLDTRNAVKLSKGAIDVWVVGFLPGLYHSQVKGLPKPKKALTLTSKQMYLALNINTSDDIVDKLQRALDQMKKDGTYQSIVDRNLQSLGLLNPLN